MTLWQEWMVGQIDASVAAVVLLAVATMFRRSLSPRVRSAILLIALVRLALPPWLRSPWSESLVDLPPVDDTRLLVVELLRADVASVVFMVTTVVATGVLARLACQTLVMRQRLANLAPAPSALQATVNRLAGHASIDVRVSRSGEGPFAVGLLRRRIVLPIALIDRLDDASMEAVLAHEVAHHARRDLFWIAAAAVLKAVVWFNPLAHLIARNLVESREHGSDDWAVTNTSRDPFAYTHALLQSARAIVAVPPPLVAAGAHPMGKRVQRLLDAGASRDRRFGVAGIVIIVTAATLGLPGAHTPALNAQEAQDNAVIVIKRVRADTTVNQIRRR